MAQMTEQSRQQHAAARAAAKDLHTAQLALQTGQGEAQELEEEKQSLQQLADTMQQSLASNSQVCMPAHYCLLLGGSLFTACLQLCRMHVAPTLPAFVAMLLSSHKALHT